MATSNQSDEKFCSFCDPSPVKAICSRSNIAGDDLTFGVKSFIGATPEHFLCEVREHLIQHGQLWTGQNESSFSS
jgi:hypothetical protein